jgi:hypothetical protein
MLTVYSSVLAPDINPLNAQLNPICHFLAVLGAHPILHISRIKVNEGKGECEINRTLGAVTEEKWVG